MTSKKTKSAEITKALERYKQRTGHELELPLAVLFDMDGVLYDSMPDHCRAWKQMCDENGIIAEPEEFLAYEGRTGASTIDILLKRQFGRGATDDDVTRLYGRKSELFKAMGEPPIMPGAQRALDIVAAKGALPVLVTGSGQASILTRLDRDYPGRFPAWRRVTAHDVKYGKPDPEPYLMGMQKAHTQPWRTIAVDNAPLGVESASRSGAFTIGVRTGPLPEGALMASGADIEIFSMEACADLLSDLL